MNWFKKSYFFIFLMAVSYVISSSYGLVSDVATEMVLASDYVADANSNLAETEVIPGGNVIGIKLYTQGVLVVDLASFEDASGNIVCPAGECGIQAGDKIISVNGEKIEKTSELVNSVKKSVDRSITLDVIRDDMTFNFKIDAVKSGEDGQPKIGVWVRDSAAGIGTLTFINPENKSFFALGHGITDKDVKKRYSVREGTIEMADVMSVDKSTEGVPGEIRASFGKNGQSIGNVKENCECGIYGTYTGECSGKPVKVASRWQIKEGPATILCSVDGQQPKEYKAQISKIMLGGGFSEKSMVIEVTDPELIAKTGGIVQGMSGSPIMQDGKLVGAVTHVFIKNPLKGYGIFIENMLAEAEKIK